MSERFLRIDQTAIDAVARNLDHRFPQESGIVQYKLRERAEYILDAAYRAQTKANEFGADLEHEFAKLDQENTQ